MMRAQGSGEDEAATSGMPRNRKERSGNIANESSDDDKYPTWLCNRLLMFMHREQQEGNTSRWQATLILLFIRQIDQD